MSARHKRAMAEQAGEAVSPRRTMRTMAEQAESFRLSAHTYRCLASAEVAEWSRNEALAAAERCERAAAECYAIVALERAVAMATRQVQP